LTAEVPSDHDRVSLPLSDATMTYVFKGPRRSPLDGPNGYDYGLLDRRIDELCGMLGLDDTTGVPCTAKAKARSPIRCNNARPEVTASAVIADCVPGAGSWHLPASHAPLQHVFTAFLEGRRPTKRELAELPPVGGVCTEVYISLLSAPALSPTTLAAARKP
jgi:hypothetical protein